MCVLERHLLLAHSDTSTYPLQWGEGGASQYPRGSDISSFEVLDALVAYYGSKNRYPRLEHLAIVGHSMGGQLVQRFSVLGRPSSQVPLSYVAMNSSTYMYLNNEEYKYGLRNMGETLSCYRPAFVDINELQHRIRSRQIHYLQGALDKGVGDERDDAMKQGKIRAKREWQRTERLMLLVLSREKSTREIPQLEGIPRWQSSLFYSYFRRSSSSQP